jgi:hypothetical protein
VVCGMRQSDRLELRGVATSTRSRCYVAISKCATDSKRRSHLGPVGSSLHDSYRRDLPTRTCSPEKTL